MPASMNILQSVEHETSYDWTTMGIVKRLNDQRRMIEQIQHYLETLVLTDTNSESDQTQEKVTQLQDNLQFALEANQKLADMLLALRERVSRIERENMELKQRLPPFRTSGSEDGSLAQGPNPSHTIRAVLTLLKNEGPISSREISRAIGRSREHTARLMRRILREGLVTTVDNVIPARYVLAAQAEASAELREDISPR